MSQTTLTSFFNSRKRPASEDIVTAKSKIAHVDRNVEGSHKISRINLIKKNLANTIESQKTTTATDEKTTDTVTSNEQPSELKKSEAVPCPVFAKKSSASNISKDRVKQAVTTARKELSLGDIKKKLSGSSRLADLKASAERISKGIQQLKEASATRNLKEFKSIDVEVPLSPSKRPQIQNELLSPGKEISACAGDRPLISPRKVFVSPVKSPTKVPAYIKHASLATTSSSLPLPHHYRFLAELFRGMETVVSLLYNRNEKITFNKLKPSIQEMLKRNFKEKHLAQIKQLVPDFYSYQVEKIKSFATSAQREAYELVISPNIPSDLKVMNPNVLLERRRYFYNTLLQLAKKHHANYLHTLDPPMVIPDSKLTRWHPEFELEKISDVECSKLPEMPNVEKFSSAQDVLSKARELFKCNTKMERALEKLAQSKAQGQANKAEAGLSNSKTSSTSTQTSLPSTSSVTILNPALRNLPASLLEKVKAKQAAKALEAMTRSADTDKKYLIYTRLPDLARTLRNIFVTERKNVLALNIILSKLESSFKSNVTSNDLQRDIKALTEEVPEWAKLHDIRNTVYLKLDKNADLKAVISKLEVTAAKYKSD